MVWNIVCLIVIVSFCFFSESFGQNYPEVSVSSYNDKFLYGLHQVKECL